AEGDRPRYRPLHGYVIPTGETAIAVLGVPPKSNLGPAMSQRVVSSAYSSGACAPRKGKSAIAVLGDFQVVVCAGRWRSSMTVTEPLSAAAAARLESHGSIDPSPP